MKCRQDRNRLIEVTIENSRNWQIDKATDTRIDITWKKDGTFMKFGVVSIYVDPMSQIKILYSTRFTARLSDDLMKIFMKRFQSGVWKTIIKKLRSQKLFPKRNICHEQTDKFIYDLPQ